MHVYDCDSIVRDLRTNLTFSCDGAFWKCFFVINWEIACAIKIYCRLTIITHFFTLNTKFGKGLQVTRGRGVFLLFGLHGFQHKMIDFSVFINVLTDSLVKDIT